MPPTEEELAEAAAAAAEAKLAAATGGGEDPPAEPEEPQEPPAEPEEPQDPTAEPDPAQPPPLPRGSRTLEARIGKLTAEKRAAAQRAAAAEAEVARLRAASGGAPPPAPEGDAPADPPPAQRHQFRTQAEFDAAVAAEAQRRADLNDWNTRCNAVEDKGAKLPGWAEAKRSLALLDDNGVIPFSILEVALETENPEKVILALGQDPDRAQEILDMRPARRALEIARLSQGPTPKPPPRSEAPPPVDPIRGRGTPATTRPSDKDSDAEWLRKRNAEIEAKRIAEAARIRSMS